LEIYRRKIMNNSIKIFPEMTDDFDDIINIHNLAFKNNTEGKIVNLLRRNDKLYLSLICKINKLTIGHIAFSPMYNKLNQEIGIGLGPIGVLPKFQNMKVGSTLINNGIEQILKLNVKYIFVLGDPKYYMRFGFTLARQFNYFCKYDIDGNNFMCLGVKEKLPQKEVINYCTEFDI